jgi:hypothetical protein
MENYKHIYPVRQNKIQQKEEEKLNSDKKHANQNPE